MIDAVAAAVGMVVAGTVGAVVTRAVLRAVDVTVGV